MANDYGLELTANSKAGWAFSLPRHKTCINATQTCWQLCYGNGIRYQAPAQKHKRLRNYRTVELLLRRGGSELLAKNLIALLDAARPVDWLAAEITGQPTCAPWTVRLHDVGDFWGSLGYIRAWQIAAIQRPACALWFYTRTFHDRRLLNALSELAALPNCQGWLSLDSQNYVDGLRAYAGQPPVWKLALLQEPEDKLPPDLIPAIRQHAAPGNVVNFPFHRGAYHVKPVEAAPLTTCPQIIGGYALERAHRKPKPCQACTFCLPQPVCK